jgi:hypothetical protein
MRFTNRRADLDQGSLAPGQLVVRKHQVVGELGDGGPSTVFPGHGGQHLAAQLHGG